MLNELDQMAQQTRQTKLNTKQQQLQLSGDQYKQNAWRRAQNPYIQSMNAFLGLGGLGIWRHEQCPPRPGKDRRGCVGRPDQTSNRSFSWSNSTSVSGSRNSHRS